MLLRALAAVVAVLLLSGCGGGTGPAGPSVAPCPPTCPGSAPPAPAPAGPAPAEGSAAYDALVVEPGPDELARGGNDQDPRLTQRVLDVVVPAGRRLRDRVVCQGRSSVTLTTDPTSGAESELACTEDAPREVIVEEDRPHAAATAVHVVVTAPAPARWYVVLSAARDDPGRS